jgi:hypothetical protein
VCSAWQDIPCRFRGVYQTSPTGLPLISYRWRGWAASGLRVVTRRSPALFLLLLGNEARSLCPLSWLEQELAVVSSAKVGAHLRSSATPDVAAPQHQVDSPRVRGGRDGDAQPASLPHRHG